MKSKLLNFIKKSYIALNNFDAKLDFANRKNNLQTLALNNSDMLVSSMSSNLDKLLIVSLTTYSKRIHDVHLVIESIGQQTVKPDRLILWLDEEEYTLETIPYVLKKQMERGLEVLFCQNYRSYKKLIPTLQLHPEANIITIDDDVLYPHDMVELLVKEHLAFPDCIIAHRAHKISYGKSNNILPYSKWEHETFDDVKSDLIVAIGIGGIFYPAGSLSEISTDVELFMNLAPNADDIWFKAMAMLNGVEHKKVRDPRDFKNRFLVIEQSQDIALANTNLHRNENDNQINAVFSYFNLKINNN